MNIFSRYCKVSKLFSAYRRIIKQRQYIARLKKTNDTDKSIIEAAVRYIGAKYVGKYIRVDGKVDRYMYVDSVVPFNKCLSFHDVPSKLFRSSGMIAIRSFDDLDKVHIITKREYEKAVKVVS